MSLHLAPQSDLLLNGRRYRLRHPISQTGSYGHVWEAEDPQGRLVAIKVINRQTQQQADLPDRPRWPTMLTAEIAFLVRLTPEQQRHIVTLLDHGFVDDQPVLVMERMHSDLKTWLDAQRAAGHTPPLHQIVAWAMQLVEGLIVIHQAGLIHRDIKLRNVLITADGRTVKWADFGTLKPIPDPQGTLSREGTPATHAPEQALPMICVKTADGRIVYRYVFDQKADYYALGILLYELVTGCPPISPQTIQEILQEQGIAGAYERRHQLGGLCHEERQRLYQALQAACAKEIPLTCVPDASDGLVGSVASNHVVEPLCDLISRLLARAPEDRPDSLVVSQSVLQSVYHTLATGQPPQAAWPDRNKVSTQNTLLPDDTLFPNVHSQEVEKSPTHSADDATIEGIPLAKEAPSQQVAVQKMRTRRPRRPLGVRASVWTMLLISTGALALVREAHWMALEDAMTRSAEWLTDKIVPAVAHPPTWLYAPWSAWLARSHRPPNDDDALTTSPPDLAHVIAQDAIPVEQRSFEDASENDPEPSISEPSIEPSFKAQEDQKPVFQTPDVATPLGDGLLASRLQTPATAQTMGGATTSAIRESLLTPSEKGAAGGDLASEPTEERTTTGQRPITAQAFQSAPAQPTPSSQRPAIANRSLHEATHEVTRAAKNEVMRSQNPPAPTATPTPPHPPSSQSASAPQRARITSPSPTLSSTPRTTTASVARSPTVPRPLTPPTTRGEPTHPPQLRHTASTQPPKAIPRVKVEPPIALPMIHLPKGELVIHDPRTRRPQRIVLKPFAISQRAITFAEFALFCQETNCTTRSEITHFAFHPVVEITWYEAHAFTRWLTQKTGQRYRLPTKAEWAYAVQMPALEVRVQWWEWLADCADAIPPALGAPSDCKHGLLYGLTVNEQGNQVATPRLSNRDQAHINRGFRVVREL